MKNFHKLLFFCIMVMSTMLAISSMSWITIWIGLEANLLSLMPLMKHFNNKYSAEATIKYFIIQAMASATLLFIVITFIGSMKLQNIDTWVSIMLSAILLLKLGAAPFHFWFPETISGLNWNMTIILLTWQKIAPMILLSYISTTPLFLSIIIIISSMISGFQGLNQTCMRKILAYSSINHMSWMISAILNSSTVWFYYFFIYCIINMNIIAIFNTYNIFFINQLPKLFAFKKKIKFFFMLNFLSLGGLPPLLGFFPKWLTINYLINNNYYTLAIMLIILTLISLYFYLRVAFSTFSLNTEESITSTFKNMNAFYFFLNLIALMSLILCSVMTNFL